MTTNSPVSMFRADYQNKEVDEYLRKNRGIDSKLLAIDLGMSPNRVEAYQRQLGLRPIADNNPGATRNGTDGRGRYKGPRRKYA